MRMLCTQVRFSRPVQRGTLGAAMLGVFVVTGSCLAVLGHFFKVREETSSELPLDGAMVPCGAHLGYILRPQETSAGLCDTVASVLGH